MAMFRKVGGLVGKCAAARYSQRVITATPLREILGVRPAAVRCFASSPDGALLKVLKSEIAHEKEQEIEGVEPAKAKPPAPFTLENKAGTHEIILRRSFGQEDIAVTCVFSVNPYDPPEEDEDDEDNDQPSSQEEVQMNVTISKSGDGPVLEFSCTCTEGEIQIEKVSYLEGKSTKDDEIHYTGPDFEELDEDLQKQFKKYLQARGINEELCTYLVNFMPEKDRQEYISWLQKIESFLKK